MALVVTMHPMIAVLAIANTSIHGPTLKGVSSKKYPVGGKYMISKYTGRAAATHNQSRRSRSAIDSTLPSPISTSVDNNMVRYVCASSP